MRIKELTLYSKNIEEQKEFYGSVLEIPIIPTNDGFTIKLKHSKINFVFDENTTPYHFAITIPYNKINESLIWLKQRTKIIKDDEHEVVDFKAWNAQSIYFYDAAENIVEFIARKTIDNKENEPFSVKSLLCISEIGLATKNFDKVRKTLFSEIRLIDYGGKSEAFNALGDENGLIILVDHMKKHWFPSNDIAYASAFSAYFDVEDSSYFVEFANEELKILKK